jgi:hypothetical protein
MAAPSKQISVLRIIETNHDKFTSDPDYAKGLKTLNHQKLREATHGLKENIANFVNYYVFQRNMTSIKITKGTISEEAEKTVVARSRDALRAFQRVSSSLVTIRKLMEASGLSKVVDRHIESLCQHLNYNPKVLAMMHEIKDMGITEAEIACVMEELRKNKYNILKYGGANGTFSSFVDFCESLNSSLEKEHKVIEEHGLPTLQGGSNPGAVAVAVAAAIIAAALCLVTTFYAPPPV